MRAAQHHSLENLIAYQGDNTWSFCKCTSVKIRHYFKHKQQLYSRLKKGEKEEKMSMFEYVCNSQIHGMCACVIF